MARLPNRWDIGPMLNALAMSGMYGAVGEALMDALERVIAALGAGTVAALVLAALVLGVEALVRRPWGRRKSRKPAGGRPAAIRTRRGKAYR